MTKTHSPGLLTTEEAAREIGTSPKTFKRIAAAHAIEPMKFGYRTLRWRPNLIERLANAMASRGALAYRHD